MAVNPIAAGPAARAGLVDAIDHLLNRGAVLSGDATLSVAGVDLVYVGLNLLISSVETLHEHGDWPGGLAIAPSAPQPPALPSPAPPHPEPRPRTLEAGEATEAGLPSASSDVLLAPPAGAEALQSLGQEEPGAEPEPVERPLARLVLTLVELLRQIVERQALRRMEGQSLTEDQIERMGRSLMELSGKMAEMRDLFGLEAEDLAIDLGPLGRLL